MDKVKENAMKASYLVSLVAATLLLSACGGSNPFKFNSDPLGERITLKGMHPADLAQRLAIGLATSATLFGREPCRPCDVIAAPKPILKPRLTDQRIRARCVAVCA